MSNRLKNETSPYLLQHSENPVNWYSWCEEAFQKAREEEKPIFLSIGYSTCHWCHVMAHESFEDDEIADILNRHFVSIKVDREERPDIDSIYMSVCQAFTGSGGWPTSIFMTPDQKPFFAGTYFPKSNRGRMAGLRELLTVIADKWENDRDTLIKQSEYIVEQLQTSVTSSDKPKETLPDEAVSFYKRIYDKKYGGFGNAPKFPTSHNLLFLLAYYQRFDDKKCLEMAEHTLMQMYKGGMFDHIGYGFSRYSTDKYFLVPHFEKMLYDNALLISAYCKAYSVTSNEIYLEIAEKTANYVLREMMSDEGGFYSAQDADSEGEEGKYYLFTPDELIELLGKERGIAFNEYYDISESGNFEGKNIPNLLEQEVLNGTFDDILPVVENYRKDRYKLHLDDKILAFWNSLMIDSLCTLYRVSGKEKYLDSAINAERAISENLSDGDKLYVSYRDGKHGVEGFLDDYAGYIHALIGLYEATLNRDHLDKAKRLCAKVMLDFLDVKNGGYYLYGRQSEELILRPKETYDGALPSGNSLMAYNLVRMSLLLDERIYTDEAEKQLDFLATESSQYPSGYSMFLLSLLEYTEPSAKIVAVLGDKTDREKIPLFAPSDALVRVMNAPTDEYPLKDEKTTFYICKGHVCLPPTTDWSELK